LRTLYIANKNYSSWSLRPWLLLTELQIPFEERLVPFGADAASGGFKSFSPSGTVPCLVDGDFVVWDSLAIVEYVAELDARTWPAQPLARAWARSASAEMHAGFPNIRTTCTMNCGLRVRMDDMSQALQREWARVNELWSHGLQAFGGPFLAGPRFTAADAFFAPLAFRCQTYSPPLSQGSLDYVRRILALPGMQRWYDAALRETWRDEAHELEARAAGTWLCDLRAVQPLPSGAA